jgi:hypothetical protein
MTKHILFLSIFALASCSTYKSVGLSVEHPAVIDLRPEVKRVTFVNRTIPESSKTTAGNVVEAIFSGESIMADRLGAKSALNGMQFALSQTNRLQVVGSIVDMKTNTVIQAPTAFTWAVIDSLCQANGSNMIVACEFFDSDQIGTIGGIPATNAPSSGAANVRAYFRVYDNINRLIVDEQMMRYNAGGGGGTMVLQGANNIERRAYGTGYAYGRMLVPFTNFERRNIYHAGSKDMRSASKLARAGNWLAAENIWADLENSGKRRQAYRAAFNRAVAAEAAGNLSQALSFAEKAFSMKPNTSISKYMRVLSIRMEEQVRLARQKATE